MGGRGGVIGLGRWAANGGYGEEGEDHVRVFFGE